jgi:hypothetical protein
VGCTDGSDAGPAGQTGSDVIDDGQQLCTVFLELAFGLGQRQGETAWERLRLGSR